jgi:hypothetical protein
MATVGEKNDFDAVEKMEVSSDSEHGLPMEDGHISLKTKLAVLVSHLVFSACLLLS